MVFVHVRACVLWALGFSRADVSNQSLSRGSLSLYPFVGGATGRWGRTGPSPLAATGTGGGLDDVDDRTLRGGAAWSR